MPVGKSRMPGSPPAPPSPPPSLEARRRPTSRACDRCRRRKAKCDLAEGESRCALCRDANEQCTFNLPLGRRGPKAKRRNSLGELALARPPAENNNSSAGVVTTSPLFTEPGAPTGLSSLASASESPVSAWESARGLAVDHALSPQTVRSSLSDLSGAVHPISAPQRWHQLCAALARRNVSPEGIVNHCFDLFFEYLFPLTPLVHEPSVREGLAFFLGQPPPGLDPSLTHPDARPPSLSRIPEAWNEYSRASISDATGAFVPHWPDATFTLVTAICAEAAFMLPKELFPEGERVADMFLQASRSCLGSYLEADLESPNANSIAIRYFHSNCVHAAGKPKYSWHIFGEATRLAQVMQLHDDSTLQGLYPVEAELRRRLFWIVYVGDKSAAILNNRPITIHKYSFASGITTSYPVGLDEVSVLRSSPGNSVMSDAPRGNFIDGFNANLRLWQAASDLILEIRLMEASMASSPTPKPHLSVAERERLDSLYISFITCLDNLPPHLNGGKETAESNQYIIQCANLQVSLHCLRMVITQKFEDIAYFSPGIEQGDLRKTEIARDMIRVMHEAPFWSLRVNGEPYVEKIRLIGASLLEIIHRHGSSPLAARARGDFSVLLDILTRLDSKASDALRNNSSWVI
ncbi:hypothetical protein B0I35DRAFT_470733 [Stachybotrys elegans]|uniref:Zn(2)-C6 fungal-type domain-containing protein n=1 Tax=Stachybotrys elegans TaxID=80388 RepID=A0A8K0SJX1_9HYPO|nr:hypothetical protein B0I35DRAFT_470733 [Stachybotrys elegans]